MKQYNLFRVIVAVFILVSYFLPWFSGSAEVGVSDINGFGRGRFTQYTDGELTASLVWEFGWLNLIGMVLIIVVLIFDILPLLNISIGQKKEKIATALVSLSLLLGLVYEVLFLSGSGDIEIRVGEVLIVPLTQWLDILAKYGFEYSIGYGFIVFIALSIALIFLCTKKEK